MKLHAILTYGWPADQQPGRSASALHEAASAIERSGQPSYQQALEQALARVPDAARQAWRIEDLAHRVRRRTGGFTGNERLLGARCQLL